jgi:hypothetical protein
MTWWIVAYFAIGFIHAGYDEKNWQDAYDPAPVFRAPFWPLILLLDLGAHVRRISDEQE